MALVGNGQILKVEPVGLSDELDIGYERKTE